MLGSKEMQQHKQIKVMVFISLETSAESLKGLGAPAKLSDRLQPQ